MMTENSYKILNYLKKNNPSTAKEVAAALEMEKRRVDSYFSAAIEGADLGYRDRNHTPSKLFLNEKGLAYEQD